MIKALIIDDEQSAVETLRLMLKKYCTEVEVIATANDLSDLASIQLSNTLDAVFLDINFGDYTGFDVLKKVEFNNSRIVFVTAYDQYGVEAIKNGAFDYIIKPVDPEELIETVNKLLKAKFSLKSDTSVRNNEYIMIPVNNTHTRIKVGDICCIEADGAYSKVMEFDKSYFCAKPLKYFEDLLPTTGFFRVHNSFLVRIDSIKSVKMGRDQPVILKNGDEIPVARNRRKDLMTLLDMK